MRFEMHWPRHDRGDQTVDRADADIAAMAIATQNLIEFIIGVYRLAHAATLAASASRAAFQFQAKSSCSWLFFVRPETIRFWIESIEFAGIKKRRQDCPGLAT